MKILLVLCILLSGCNFEGEVLPPDIGITYAQTTLSWPGIYTPVLRLENAGGDGYCKVVTRANSNIGWQRYDSGMLVAPGYTEWRYEMDIAAVGSMWLWRHPEYVGDSD